MQIMMFGNSLEQTKDGYRHFRNRVTAIFLRLHAKKIGITIPVFFFQVRVADLNHPYSVNKQLKFIAILRGA